MMAVTKKHYRLCDLNSRNSLSHRSGGQRSKIMVLGHLGSSEASLLGSQKAWPPTCHTLTLSLLSLVVCVLISSCKEPVKIGLGPTLMASS